VISRPWRKLTPFLLYGLIVTGLGTAAVLSQEGSLIGRALLIGAGLLSWGLGEYVMHRFAFHYEHHLKGLLHVRTMHLGHHDNPLAMDHLFVSPWLCFPTAIAYCLVAWAILGDWQSMSFLFIGASIGYFAYEFLHYHAHHSHPRLGPLKYLKKYHLLHHGETPNLRFGVTSPIFDHLFRTFQSVNNHR
jgi:hypothetical protein